MIIMEEGDVITRIKVKSAYLKALIDVKELVEEGYTREMLLEWLNERIERKKEEISWITTGNLTV